MPPENTLHFGTEMQKKRIKMGLSQEALSSATRISRATISHIECGRRNPRIEDLQLICSELNLRVSEIMKKYF